MTLSKKQAFEVVRGGRFMPVPSVAAFGIDSGELDEHELGALRWVRDAGYAIAVLAPSADQHMRDQLAAREIPAIILADDEGPAAESDAPFTTAAARAEALARLCAQRGVTMEQAVVIAVVPQDCEAMMAAGRALALHGAGYDACAAAEQVFLPRLGNGLAHALNAVAAMRV